MHDRARKPQPDDEGSDWLYWSPPERKWRRVEILAVPSDDARRARIQQLDGRAKAEWVPISRLRVPWADRGPYLARERRWERVRDGGPRAHIADTASSLLSRYVDDDVADFTTADGVLIVRDMQRLSKRCGIGAEVLISDPRAFEEADYWALPWTVGERVIVALCQRDVTPALRMFDEEMRGHQDFDRLVAAEGPRWWQRTAELEASERKLAERTRRSHEDGLAATQQLRDWLGAGHQLGLAQAYLELRGMYSDLFDAAREASPRLRMDRTQISKRIADRLDELVGRATPVVDVAGLRADEDW